MEKRTIIRSSRNAALDVLKLIAAYMVVLIHAKLYGGFGEVTAALARFAVPLFFITSGYFCLNNDTDKIKKKAQKLLVLFTFAAVIYTLYTVITQFIYGGPQAILAHFEENYTVRNLIKFLAVNVPVSAEHLWFLSALIYCYVIQYFVVRFNISGKIVFFAGFAGIMINLILGEGLGAFGIVVPIPLVRNFMFMGYPFFAAGQFMRQYRDKILSVSDITIYIILAAGITETVISRILFGHSELYFGTVLVVAALMILVLKYPNICLGIRLDGVESLSTYIYLYHMLILEIIRDLADAIEFDLGSVLAVNITPFAVCILSTVTALIIYKVRSRTGVQTN